MKDKKKRDQVGRRGSKLRDTMGVGMKRGSPMPVGATGVQHRPPWQVMVVSGVFVVAGVAGIVYHLPEWGSHSVFHGILPLVVRLLAIVCGVFLFLGKKWARWLAVVWLAYHVVLSAFHSGGQTVFHLVLLVVFAWVLFRPDAGRYFRGV